MLRLKTGDVPTRRETSLTQRGAGRLNRAARCVIQLDGPLTPDRARRLQRIGVRLGAYLPEHAYVARLPAGFDAGRIDKLPFVRWVGHYENRWKLSPEIGRQPFKTARRKALAAAGRLRLVAALFADVDRKAALASLARLPGVQILNVEPSGDVTLVELVGPADTPGRLAKLDPVQWVEEAPEPVLRNDTNRWIVQSNVLNVTPVWDHGIHGEGQFGGVIDGAMKSDHCAFADPLGNPIGPLHRKIEAYFGTLGSSSHGTHVSATYLGDEQPISGTSTYRGIAYAAKAVFTNFHTEITSTNLYSKLVQAHDAGARIHTNSWGNDGTTSYIAWSRDVDRFAYDHEDDLVLFAVTNLNSTVRTPENAKNCLAVAASTDTPAEDHCIGGTAPTQDGRRKPELLAPGCGTLSALISGSCNFGTAGNGTSFATPAVAGAAVLTRQYYTEGFYPGGAANPSDAIVPSGALVKATLINSGADVSGIPDFPSEQEGWGRVLLDNALFFAGDDRKLLVPADIRNADGLTTGQSLTYQVEVTDPSEPLKATLVWTEKEAALSANPAFINDLNLVVGAPGGVTYLGNDFAGGQSTTGGSADFRNNVEQVLLNAPVLGVYTVSVDAEAVNTVDPQGFALVVTGGVTEFNCVKGDVNGDGLVDGRDIRRFVEVLTLGGGTAVENCAGDVGPTRDLMIGEDDVPSFVDCLMSSGCS